MGRKCYTGKVLRIDLSTEDISVERTNTVWANDFVGGKGLAFRYLFDALSAGVDPLSPDNVIVLFPGVLAGTPVATTSRTAVVSRSPASGTILDSYVGGAFGLHLKLAGFDGVIINGRAKSPSSIIIQDNNVKIIDSIAAWGKGIWETDIWLKEQAGEEQLVSLVTGPAGENMVPFACLTSEGYHQAGRGGAGAVFGSKNLKGIAVHGTGSISVPEMQKFITMYQGILEKHVLIEENLWAYDEGTPIIVELSQGAGLLPTRGFSEGTFEGARKIDSTSIQKRKRGNRSCAACPLACGQQIENSSGLVEGPEYETLGLGGANCGIDDLNAVISFNHLCDNLGLDTISTGNIIGLAMLMAREGIHDFGVHFGNIKEYLSITEDIAYRRGYGDDLARGAHHIANRYGAEQLVMESKGLEFPAYDPRGSYGMALAYCTSDRGGCHLRAFPVADDAFGDGDPYTLEGKAKVVINEQNINSVKWTGIFCDFWAISGKNMAKLISAGTGYQYTEEKLKLIGERIWNLGRIFNIREGFKRKDDIPPPVIFDRSLPSGPAGGRNFTREEYNVALSEYYRLRGWTEDGIPTLKKLTELGLSNLNH